MLRVISKSVATTHRQLCTSSSMWAKQIQIDRVDDKKTIVSGKPVTSPNQSTLIDLDLLVPHDKNACPLCRLNLPNLTYRDVLILNQFIEPDGTMMPFEQTKLCGRKYFKVKKLVAEAQQVGLIRPPPNWASYGPWEQLNSYHEYPKRHRDQPMRMIEPDYWK